MKQLQDPFSGAKVAHKPDMTNDEGTLLEGVQALVHASGKLALLIHEVISALCFHGFCLEKLSDSESCLNITSQSANKARHRLKSWIGHSRLGLTHVHHGPCKVHLAISCCDGFLAGS